MLPKELNALLNNNKWEDAIAFLSNPNTKLSDDELSALAWSYSRIGKYDKAIQLYSQLIQHQPNIAKWYYAKGYQFYMQKKWQEAIKNFNEALNLFDKYFVVKYRIAYAYIQISGNTMQWSKDSFWKAINHLEDCHRIYKTYSEEERERHSATYGNICALHGKTIMSCEKYLNKSILLLERAVKIKNDNDFKYQLAKAYYNNRQYSRALEVLSKLKNSYYVLELKSQIFSAMENYRKSNDVLFELIKFRKKDYLYRRISENFFGLKEFDTAEKFAKRAIDMDKNNYKNFMAYGLALKEEQMYKSAIVAFEKTRQLKQTKYHLDCVEAITNIETIQNLTNGIPTDVNINIGLCEQSRYVGEIIKYNEIKGYGFIFEESSNESVFFHISSFKSQNHMIGKKVEFEIEITKKGKKAINICEIKI